MKEKFVVFVAVKNIDVKNMKETLKKMKYDPYVWDREDYDDKGKSFLSFETDDENKVKENLKGFEFWY